MTESLANGRGKPSRDVGVVRLRRGSQCLPKLRVKGHAELFNTHGVLLPRTLLESSLGVRRPALVTAAQLTGASAKSASTMAWSSGSAMGTDRAVAHSAVASSDRPSAANERALASWA